MLTSLVFSRLSTFLFIVTSFLLKKKKKSINIHYCLERLFQLQFERGKGVCTSIKAHINTSYCIIFILRSQHMYLILQTYGNYHSDLETIFLKKESWVLLSCMTTICKENTCSFLFEMEGLSLHLSWVVAIPTGMLHKVQVCNVVFVGVDTTVSAYRRCP